MSEHKQQEQFFEEDEIKLSLSEYHALEMLLKTAKNKQDLEDTLNTFSHNTLELIFQGTGKIEEALRLVGWVREEVLK